MGKSRGERSLQNFGPPEYREYLHQLPCSIRKCHRWPIEQAHARQHGLGSWKETLPLCRNHHREQHRGRKTFEKKYQINLTRVAREVYDAWMGLDW